jgi:16S rRNA (adenine1518-N6/adenine1519-N6)-dimethyltransferase
LLLAEAGEVHAIEMDRRLVEFLRGRFVGTNRLTLLHNDALEWLRQNPRDWSEWKLVANLPYSVASPILVELAQGERGPLSITVTLQLEVARRLMAAAGGADYSVLTLLVQLDYEPLGWFKIPAGCFFPAPDVDSACLTLVRRPERALSGEQREAFVKLVKRAFSQRRKMMMKLLKAEWSTEKLESAFGEISLSATIRAEAVGREQFIRLAQLLQPDP